MTGDSTLAERGDATGAGSGRARLVRWGGMAAMAAGALVCVTLPLTELVADGFFYLLGPVMALLAVALPALQAWQAGRSGWLGLAGCVLCTASAGVLAGLLTVTGVAQAALGFDPEEFGTVFWTLAAGLLVFVVGVSLFGVATAVAGVLPRPGAALLALGLPLAPVLDLLTGAFLGGGVAPPGLYVGSLIFTAGLVWLGYALWREAPSTDRRRDR